MLRILYIEWLKVRNYRAFWILLIIDIISIPAFNYGLYSLMDNSFPKVKGKSILGSPFAFPDVWQTVGWNAGLLHLVPAILIITLITNEFTYRTHRQNIIDGWSRSQFIAAKLLEVLMLAILNTIVVGLTALAFGYIGNKVPVGVSVWQESRFVFFYFVQVLSYCMIAFLLGVLIRRAGLAIGVFLIYMLIENVIVGLLGVKLKVEAIKYLPEETTDRLLPFPYIKGILVQQGGGTWESHIPGFLFAAALYLLIYCFVTSWRFLKSDL